jgi:hypothetical protein
METGNLLIDAQTAFSRQRRKRRRARVIGRLRGRSGHLGRLTELEEALGAAPPSNRRAGGLEAIPLDSIVGTAEPAKARVFDNCFRVPESSRRRWESLWMASRKGSSIPPISVFRLAGEHFVDDGHHRVSVAHALGMVAIDAEVTELAA